jgi:hypothetical protein
MSQRNRSSPDLQDLEKKELRSRIKRNNSEAKYFDEAAAKEHATRIKIEKETDEKWHSRLLKPANIPICALMVSAVYITAVLTVSDINGQKDELSRTNQKQAEKIEGDSVRISGLESKLVESEDLNVALMQEKKKRDEEEQSRRSERAKIRKPKFENREPLPGSTMIEPQAQQETRPAYPKSPELVKGNEKEERELGEDIFKAHHIL